jgi:tetratricopeptide (TPR) repeat protein
MDSQEENLPYCLPILLAPHTRAEQLVFPTVAQGFRGISDAARQDLKEAVNYFSQINQAEPAYAPAWLNSAVTAFYLDEFDDAESRIKKARKLAPNHPDLEMFLALLSYQQGDADAKKQALQQIRRLADKPEAGSCEIYNAAVLLEKQEQAADAAIHWQRLAQPAARLPEPWRGQACRKHSCPSSTATEAPVPVTLPVAAGLALSQSVLAGLQGWEAIELADYRGHIYRAPNGVAEILALPTDNGEYADMVVVKTPELSKLPESCVKTPSLYVQSEIWNCGTWSAVKENGKVREIWTVPGR